MTPADVIAEARRLISDVDLPNRYSDTDLLGYINQIIKRMVILRPDLFASVGDISTEANSIVQTLPSDSYRLIEIYQVKNGNAITEVNREVLDQTYPAWVSDPAGVPYNYMRHVRHPNKYFLYPKPVANITLIGEYAKIPSDYAIDATIDLPEAYFPSLVDGTVFLAESIDDEHVNSGRAKMFMDMFVESLGTGLQGRPITDTEESGMSKGQVI
jgi:hypothetical protein